VLDQKGAEVLAGSRANALSSPGASNLLRSQGTFIDDRQIRDSVKIVKVLPRRNTNRNWCQISRR